MATQHKKKKQNVSSKAPPNALNIPFWSPMTDAASKLLWSPTTANLQQFEKHQLNVRTEYIATHRTWFNVSRTLPSDPIHVNPKITSEYISKVWPATTDNIPLPCVIVDAKGKITRPKTKISATHVSAVKVKLHPRNPTDRKVLMQTFGDARWTYNKCVATFNDPEKQAERDLTVNPKTGKPLTITQFLCQQVINSDSPCVLANPWLLDTSYDIRNGAHIDFMTALKTNKTQMKNKAITKFKIGYKSRKYINSESFYVRRRWISQTDNTVIIKLPNREPIEMWTGNNAWHGVIGMDCRLQRTWTNDFYLCIPSSNPTPNVCEVENQDLPIQMTNEEIPPSTQTKQHLRVCALDPGVRTFQTVYDPSMILNVGDGDMKRIFRMCKEQDRLISVQNDKETKSRRRCHIKRAVRRLRTRIHNAVNEVHKQLAKHLAKSYDLIMIPSFETQKMVRKQDRKIRSTTARQMVTWAHYRFRERLINKCREYSSKVAIVNEAYTSKTCSCCGSIHTKLGSSKVFKCPTCHVVMDRDANGAKNIFLRNFEALKISIDSLGTYPLQPSDGLVHGSSRKRVSAGSNECLDSE